MLVSKYFVYFIIFSCMGWIYETIYCTIRSGKWENRGFLYGPACPIYGTGALLISMIVDALSGGIVNLQYTWWQVFLVAFFGSIVLEYVTSWALEKLFHAYWWDYSNKPLNINGRVCFPYSVGFGFGGILVVYVILPFTREMTEWISPMLMEVFGLLFMALLAADTTLTVSALTHFESTIVAMEEALNAHMEQFVKNVQESKQSAETRFEDGRQAWAVKLEEERERYASEHTEQMYRTMSGGYRMALKRVKGFRPKKADEGRVNQILGQIKGHMAHKKEL